MEYDLVDTGKRVHDVLCGEKSWKHHPEHELKPGEICPTCTLGLRVMTLRVKSEAAIDKHQTPVTYLEHEQDKLNSNGSSSKWQRTTLTASTVTNGRTK